MANILQVAAIQQANFTAIQQSEYGYETLTTFWADFTIADAFGIKSVKDTFKRAFDEWKTDYKYLTELAVVVNQKCWYWYDKGNYELSELYQKYYYKVRDYAYKHLKGEEIQYYYQVTD